MYIDFLQHEWKRLSSKIDCVGVRMITPGVGSPHFWVGGGMLPTCLVGGTMPSGELTRSLRIIFVEESFQATYVNDACI